MGSSARISLTSVIRCSTEPLAAASPAKKKKTKKRHKSVGKKELSSQAPDGLCRARAFFHRARAHRKFEFTPRARARKAFRFSRGAILTKCSKGRRRRFVFASFFPRCRGLCDYVRGIILLGGVMLFWGFWGNSLM